MGIFSGLKGKNKFVIVDSNILIHDHLKILGVIIDKHFIFVPHAQCVVKGCNYHIQVLCRIRRLLSRDVANTIVCRIVGSIVGLRLIISTLYFTVQREQF